MPVALSCVCQLYIPDLVIKYMQRLTIPDGSQQQGRRIRALLILR